MPKPISEVITPVPWAESAANYPAGAHDWSAQPLAVLPIGDYFTPDVGLPAEHENYLHNAHGENAQADQTNQAQTDLFLHAAEPNSWCTNVFAPDWNSVVTGGARTWVGADFDPYKNRWLVIAHDDARYEISEMTKGGEGISHLTTVTNGSALGSLCVGTGKPICFATNGDYVVWQERGSLLHVLADGTSATITTPALGTMSQNACWIESWIDSGDPTHPHWIIFAAVVGGSAATANVCYHVHYTGGSYVMTAVTGINAASPVAGARWIGAKSTNDQTGTMAFFIVGDTSRSYTFNPTTIAITEHGASFTLDGASHHVFPQSLIHDGSKFVLLLQAEDTGVTHKEELWTSTNGFTWTVAWAFATAPGITDLLLSEIVPLGGVLAGVSDICRAADSPQVVTDGKLFYTSPVAPLTRWTESTQGKLFSATASTARTARLRANSRGQMASFKETVLRFSRCLAPGEASPFTRNY